jgi:hypothetical protein
VTCANLSFATIRTGAFPQTAGEACAKTDWNVHAWCLMSHHSPMVIERPKPNLVAE